MALISVLVPTRNRPQLLRKALLSIAAQTLSDFEIVVVNDGGDDVSEIVELCRSKLPQPASIQYLSHSARRGLPAARNTALSASSGRYIAYLDDDDAYLPKHLEILSAALERGTADVVYGDYERVALSPQSDGFTELSGESVVNPEFDPERLLLENYVPVNCFMHSRTCVDECGIFDEWLTALEDWDLWFRFSMKFRFVHVPELTCQVCSVAGLSTISTDQKSGFAWASLNCLYKCRAAVSGAPALQAFYEQRAVDALRHIREHIFRLWEERRPDLSEIFSFHSPKRVFERLKELESLYGIEPALFRELQGLMLAQAGDFAAACSVLEEVLILDPANESAPKVLALLKSAGSSQ